MTVKHGRNTERSSIVLSKCAERQREYVVRGVLGKDNELKIMPRYKRLA